MAPDRLGADLMCPECAPLTARLEALERRVRHLEDVAEIQRLIATYAPAIDSGSTAVAAELWTERGTYDLNHEVFRGQAGISAFLESRRHRANIEAGCGHPSSPTRVTVDGDRAIATGYQTLVRRDDDRFGIPHHSATVWEFVRTERGWRVDHRRMRRLDGGAQARSLLATDLPGSSGD